MFHLHPTFHGLSGWIGFLLILGALIGQYWIVFADYRAHDRSVILRAVSISTFTLLLYSMFK